MVKFVTFLVHILKLVADAKADDDYIYGDDYIIGASAAESNSLPFVVSFNFIVS